MHGGSGHQAAVWDGQLVCVGNTAAKPSGPQQRRAQMADAEDDAVAQLLSLSLGAFLAARPHTEPLTLEPSLSIASALAKLGQRGVLSSPCVSSKVLRYRRHPCHAMPRRAMPRHATPRHATPRHATPRHATPRHATPRHATPCHARKHG
jgi:hypothetical protein